MAISRVHMWKMIRDAQRDDYEARIASGETERLSPALEAVLFEYQDDQVLTLGHALPLDELNTKVDECTAQAGMSRREFKAAVLDREKDKL